jgi:methyl-CpG-binding domain protein 4
MQRKRKEKRSPYNMLQEIYRDDPWRVLVCCVLLNLTTRAQVDGVRHRLFERFPTAKDMASARPDEIRELIVPLGLSNKRAVDLKRMSADYLCRAWTSPTDLHGIGKYGADAYQIFVRNQRVADPNDHFLGAYQDWLYEGRLDEKRLRRAKKFDKSGGCPDV